MSKVSNLARKYGLTSNFVNLDFSFGFLAVLFFYVYCSKVKSLDYKVAWHLKPDNKPDNKL